MVYTKKFLASASAKRMPEWLLSHPTWKTTKKIEKIFPSFGLTNCMEPCAEDIKDYGTPTPTIKKMSVVFSADGITGLWDLATMSMRGVSSCMHWNNLAHRIGVIHPMTASNCGIIYLTDGTTTEYGLSMNKRTLVRYYKYPNDQFINIDRIYAKTTNRDPMVYINSDPDEAQTKRIFKEFLRSKLNSIKVC